MEPGYNSPRITPEQSPSLPPVAAEVAPQYQGAQVEQLSPVFEREQALAQPVAVAPIASVATPVLPPVASDSIAVDASAALLTALPDVAADDDLIEKEWVNKAKHIITETADDPYRREQAISQLQRDYIHKRYGKEMGAPE